MENRAQKFCSISLLFASASTTAPLKKIERKMSHLNIAFDRHAFIGAVMHYILVISLPVR